MPDKIQSAPSKNETETEKSKARIQKSLNVFNELLASSPDLTLNGRWFIEEKIKFLQEELNDDPPEDESQNLEEAIEQFQKAMAREASVATLRNGIKAYYKKGAFTDALENIKMLIQQNAVDDFCVIAAMGCMLRLYPKNELAVAVDRFISEAFKDVESGARFKAKMAQKMANKGYASYAALLQ